MSFYKYKGKRIRASDKNLVYRFCAGTLLLLFVAVLLLLNIGQLMRTDWEHFSLLDNGLTLSPYNFIIIQAFAKCQNPHKYGILFQTKNSNSEREYSPAALVITSDDRFYLLLDGAFYSLKPSDYPYDKPLIIDDDAGAAGQTDRNDCVDTLIRETTQPKLDILMPYGMFILKDRRMERGQR